MHFVSNKFTVCSQFFLVHGALRCLALVSGDIDDKMVPALVPILFPCLLTVVSSPQVSFH